MDGGQGARESMMNVSVGILRYFLSKIAVLYYFYELYFVAHRNKPFISLYFTHFTITLSVVPYVGRAEISPVLAMKTEENPEVVHHMAPVA